MIRLAEHDAAPASGVGGIHVGGQVVDENDVVASYVQSLRGEFKDAWIWLGLPNFVRVDEQVGGCGEAIGCILAFPGADEAVAEDRGAICRAQPGEPGEQIGVESAQVFVDNNPWGSTPDLTQAVRQDHRPQRPCCPRSARRWVGWPEWVRRVTAGAGFGGATGGVPGAPCWCRRGEAELLQVARTPAAGQSCGVLVALPAHEVVGVLAGSLQQLGGAGLSITYELATEPRASSVPWSAVVRSVSATARSPTSLVRSAIRFRELCSHQSLRPTNYR